MRVAYVGNYSQPHCTEVHIAKTLENLGHKVTRIQETQTRENPNWAEQVKGHDLFLYTRTWGQMVTLDDLAKIKAMGIPSASYHLDLYVGLKRESGLKDDPFWRTDYVFTPDGSATAKKVFDNYGINHYYIKPGVFKEECTILEPNSEPNLGNYVVFVGGGSAYMHKEWPYRRQLVSWLEKTYKQRYSKYGHPERTVRNIELNQLYANSGVVVGDSLCLNFDKPYYWSDRVYETIGRGGFIIHPYIKGMEEEFQDGHNIVFYEFNNWKQLQEKIDYYLNPDNAYERSQILLNGYTKVLQDCTYDNRLTQALDIIQTDDFRNIVQDMEDDLNKPSIKINLGAGEDQFEGFINVDLVDLPGIDVVHNLMEFPYPFETSSADEIRAVDLVEHLDHYTDDKRPTIIAFIEECYRILRPGGVLYMQTPGWKAEFLWIDPTHVRGFDIQSFDFFDPTKPFGQSTGFYSKAKFSVRAEELDNHNLRFWLTK